MKALIVSPFAATTEREAELVREVFAGAEVLTAKDLTDARKRIAGNVFQVAVVFVSDNGILGGHDGVQIIREVFAANEKCLIFAISDSRLPELGAECRRAGATEYVSMAWQKIPVNELLRHNLRIFERLIDANPAS
ncbi:MAG: hypothetical protein Q8P73_02740 [bacterium]|nr:hypothetical protein [bacterium]